MWGRRCMGDGPQSPPRPALDSVIGLGTLCIHKGPPIASVAAPRFPPNLTAHLSSNNGFRCRIPCRCCGQCARGPLLRCRPPQRLRAPGCSPAFSAAPHIHTCQRRGPDHPVDSRCRQVQHSPVAHLLRQHQPLSLCRCPVSVTHGCHAHITLAFRLRGPCALSSPPFTLSPTSRSAALPAAVPFSCSKCCDQCVLLPVTFAAKAAQFSH